MQSSEVYYPSPIKRLNLLTYIDFSLDAHLYRVARLKNTFVLYCDGVFDGCYQSVGDFEERLCEIFDLEIDLVSKDRDGTIIKCPPAFLLYALLCGSREWLGSELFFV